MNKEKGIVLESSKEEIEQLTKKWKKRKNLGERLLKLGRNGFIVTVLSPFDFEGPVAEILTATIATVGYGLKELSEYNLDNIQEEESIKTR